MTSMNGLERTNATLAGSPIAPGLAMGRVSLVGDILEYRPPSRPVEGRDADAEWTRIESAFAATRRDLADAGVRLEGELGSGIADVFRAHQMMLDSLRSSGELARTVREPDVDAAGAVRRVFRSWVQKFRALRDPTFQQ